MEFFTALLSNPYFQGFILGLATHFYLVKKLLEANRPTNSTHITNQRQ